MRHALIALLVIAPLAARADDAVVVKELLDKAMKAQGGADKAAQLGDLFLKGKGKIMEGGMNGEMSFELSMRGLDHVRAELDMNVGGMANKATLVITPDKIWARDSVRDKTEEIPAEVRPAMLSFLIAIRSPGMPGALGTLKDLTMTHGGEAKVDDTPVDVLRISRKDRPDVTIYFDKKTGHPIKSESLIKGPGEEEKTFTFLFSDFREAGGVKHFHKVKILQEGVELAEIEFSELKPGAKFEASTFEKP